MFPKPVCLLITVVALVSIPTWISREVNAACDPLPWDLLELGQDSRAILIGKAIEVSEDGRQAMIEVSSYLGPGEAPGRVSLPTTRDGSFSTCPDPSVKFKPEGEYIVLLEDVPPSLALLRPDGPTAFLIDGDWTVETNLIGNRKPLTEVLKLLRDAKGEVFKKPGSSAAAWGCTDEEG